MSGKLLDFYRVVVSGVVPQRFLKLPDFVLSQISLLSKIASLIRVTNRRISPLLFGIVESLATGVKARSYLQLCATTLSKSLKYNPVPESGWPALGSSMHLDLVGAP
jgi:hypothetical protein